MRDFVRVRVFLVSAILVAFHFSYAQQLKRQVIGSLGSSMDCNGYYIRQTIGQPSNTTILFGSDITLRQGFQQPMPLLYQKVKNQSCILNVYPNPANKTVFIQSNILDKSFTILITDMLGRNALYKEYIGGGTIPVTLPTMTPGMYIVRAQYPDGNACSSTIILDHE